MSGPAQRRRFIQSQSTLPLRPPPRKSTLTQAPAGSSSQRVRFTRLGDYEVIEPLGEGAMGIVVNQPAANISFPDLLVKLDVIPKAEKIQLPSRAGDVA